MKKMLSVILSLLTAVMLLAVPISAESSPGSTEVSATRYHDRAATNFSAFIEHLHAALLDRQEKIDVSAFGLPWQDSQVTSNLINYTLDAYPELFGVGSITYHSFDGETVSYLEIPYTMDKSTYQEELAVYNRLLDLAVSEIPKGMTELATVVTVHDYIAANYSYDLSYTIHDLLSFLKQKTGVCQAYSYLFRSLMQRLGISCTYAYSDEDNHMWNIVKLNGLYYHVDVTFDDPIYTDDPTNEIASASHQYLLVSDTFLEATGGHRNYYTAESRIGDHSVSCTDQSFETGYLWNDPKSPLKSPYVTYQNEFYYFYDRGESQTINGERYVLVDLMKTKDFMTGEKIGTISSPSWKAYSADRTQVATLAGFQATLSMLGSQLYYNTADAIHFYDIETGKSGIVSTAKPSGQITRSFYSANGAFTCQTAEFLLTESDQSLVPSYDTVELKPLSMGDITNDTRINSKDLACLQKYLLSPASVTDPFCLANTDLTGDRNITVHDYVRLKKMCSNLV